LRTAKIKDTNWVITIGGFRINDVYDFQRLITVLTDIVKPSIFQFLDADNIAGWEHLYMSAVNAVNAIDSGDKISKSLPLETLLYASCKDQISKALQIMGIKKDTKNLALIIFADNVIVAEEAFSKIIKKIGNNEDAVLEVDNVKFERLKKLFDISNLELEAAGGKNTNNLVNLIIERGSLLRLKR